MRIALLQTAGSPGDVAANLAAVERAAREAAAAGAGLLITPEAFLTGYDIGAARLSELATEDPPPLLPLIAASTGVAIVSGWPERHGDHVHNAAVLVDGHGEVRLRAR